MKGRPIRFSVYTKPWRKRWAQVAKFIAGLGFDGVELLVHPGYQIEPERVESDLPRAVAVFADCGLTTYSVAGPINERMIATCAKAGVPIMRTMVEVGAQGYMAAERETQQQFDAMVPLLEQYGVKLGVQNHCGRSTNNAMGLRHLIEKYDPGHIGAIWDAGHNALQGEDPEIALDIIWDHLYMVNLKNVFWQRCNGPEAECAQWATYWTSGRHGLASWQRVAAELKRRSYEGVICLTAQYEDQEALDRLIAEDLAFARSLFA